jgi:RimJ/RimL family protein N-acetyltransferase
MTVRKLRPWELHDLTPFAEAFHGEAKLGGEFSEEVFIHQMASLGQAGRLGAFGIFKDDDRLVGVLIGTIAQHFLSPVLIAQEIMWYVLPEFRQGSGSIRLVKEFENWAKELGAFAIVMASFKGTDSDDRLSAIYEKRGYSLIEQHFFKPFEQWPSSPQP